MNLRGLFGAREGCEGGAREGINPQWMYKEVPKGCAAPGCWRFLYSSREVRLSAGTCRVSIPAGGMGGWRGAWARAGGAA